MKVIAKFDRLLVKKVIRSDAEVLKGGLVKPDLKETSSYYRVLDCGPDVKTVCNGDVVVASIHAGYEICLDGEYYKLMRENEVVAGTEGFIEKEQV